MNSVAIIGSNLIGLLCADILSKENSVTIIESDLELGFPANYPGTSKNQKLISTILKNQDTKNLFLLNENGNTNFRSEWFIKLLTHKLAKNNVKISNRTRVSKISEINGLLEIYTKGSELDSNNIICNKILDFSHLSYNTIGNKNHSYQISSNNLFKPKINTKTFFVGICLIKDIKNLTTYEILIPRNDGLAEVWYQNNHQEFPLQGWIESKIVNSYFDSKLMLLEEYYSKAKEIVENMVI
tara:strand:- start:737 stop:1459 length:723 start_codon:yes stop_codon:yes gene_type:complete